MFIFPQGIRDSPDGGPVGNEDDQNSSTSNYYTSSSFPSEHQRHYNSIAKLDKSFSISSSCQTDNTTYLSVESQTDLTMQTVEEALSTVDRLRQLNSKFEVNGIYEPEGAESVESVEEEFNKLSVNDLLSNNGDSEPKIYLNDNELLTNKDDEAFSAMTKHNELTDNENNEVLDEKDNGDKLNLNKNCVLSDYVNTEGTSDTNEIKLLPGRSYEDITAHDCEDNGRHEYNRLDIDHEKDDMSVGENSERDEESEDEDGPKSFRRRRRRISNGECHSPSAESENSGSSASTASKKERRKGISAEPVRVPTWTECRERYKLNQQLELEEEMHRKPVSESCDLLHNDERISSQSASSEHPGGYEDLSQAKGQEELESSDVSDSGSLF